MKILDVGCGRNKTRGSIGIDYCDNSDADVKHDLNIFPYPFHDNEFDVVTINNVIEHLDDIVKVMEEVHRIGKNGAEVVIETPHYSSLYSWQDPTHKHHLSLDSFDYFTEHSKHSNFYTDIRFEIVEKTIYFGNSVLSVIPRLIYWVSRHKYEKHFAFLFPANSLYFKLRVVKK